VYGWGIPADTLVSYTEGICLLHQLHELPWHGSSSILTSVFFADIIIARTGASCNRPGVLFAKQLDGKLTVLKAALCFISRMYHGCSLRKNASGQPF